MNQVDVLVVGGSAAGPVAGITARRHYPDASVALIRREQNVPVPCGIPYIFGTVGSPDKNLIPDALVTGNGIELIMDDAISIDREAKTVATQSGNTYGYERLVLATGSLPLVPPLPGADLQNVFTAKKDLQYLGDMLDALEQVQDVVVIGGGFIGLEFADECRKRDLNITVVEMLPYCLYLVFDEEACAEVQSVLNECGIRVITGNRAEAIFGDGKAEGVRLDSGETLKADAVIFGIGVRPNADLAKKAELRIGERGGIWVDRYMRTSDPSIFAVGDCTEKTDFFTGEPSPLRLASIATSEARIAGANLFRLKRANKGAVGVFSTKVANLYMGMAGMREKTAREAGFDVVVGSAETMDKHPGSMPDAATQKVRLVFHRDTGMLLGGQVCGGVSVGELTNVIAALIQGGMTANDVAAFQMGTHPAMTASPIAYPLANAAEMALKEMG